MTSRFAMVTMLAMLLGLGPVDVNAQEWPEAAGQPSGEAVAPADQEPVQPQALPDGFVRVDDMVLELLPGPLAATGFTAMASTPWAGGIMPIAFDATVTQPEAQWFFDLCNGVWGSHANVRCVSRTSQPSWVAVTKANTGCHSLLGGPRQGAAGARQLNLQPNTCWNQRTVLHELGHALGFMHEQQRPDRDQFIEIRTQNIQQGREQNFAIIRQGTGDVYTQQYDFGSIMHYGATAFSANGQPTIVPRSQYSAIAAGFGTFTLPSQLDGDALRYLYGAATAAVPGVPTSVSASVSGNQVTMQWGVPASGGAPTSYFVTVQTQIGALIASGDVGNVRSVSGPLGPGTFVLGVQAKNAAGTGVAAKVQVTIGGGGGGQRPGAPANLVATVQGSTISLSWNPPVSQGAIEMYALRYGFQAGFSSQPHDLGTSTQARFDNVPAGVYYFRVLARNQHGISPDSNEVRVVVGSSAPAAPSFFPLQSRGTNVFYLSWAPGAGPVPSHYVIEVSSTPGGGANLGTVAVTGTSLQTPVVARGTYYLRIRAVTAAGVSAPSVERVLVAR